ncbi:alpha/beta-hydrolase [Macrolepiota fuliginosa MF-IS2]|uniref:Carboxypeptidase n=1 Tax=Macrolepiota fuliginosa MF-IS2 TaxID=1400762 RepID=A0A9P5XNX7_9AGAR|nr:alpha/beta-hydrolase [Macrolepiota fuliginosa MF-IS2]
MTLLKDARLLAVAYLSCSAYVLGQSQPPPKPPSSFPHVYPGQPSGDFSPDWQNYFRVKDPLPNITFPVEQSFAGNIPVQRAGHPNNTLFFVGFEKSNGSLTAPSSDNNTDPWGIWLNGGPGSSSLYGLFFENGPIHIDEVNYSASPNNRSWSQLVDYFWIDQPVGVGFSTADSDGYVHDEDQMGADFMGFLGNLVKVFPSLRTRPLYITGESYAGMYIPYIMKAYFNMENPPVKVGKFVIGDGSVASAQVFELLPALTILETYPQIIGYDQEVYKYFKAQSELCHYDVNLTYPQSGILPSIPLIEPTQRDLPFMATQLKHQNFMTELYRRAAEKESQFDKRDLVRRNASEFLDGRSFDQIDPWYGCILLWMYIDYAVNYTFPWSLNNNSDSNSLGFNVYDIPSPSVMGDASVFLNDPQTRKALNAPTSKDWEMQFPFVFGDPNAIDPSPEPMTFLTDLATNATKQNISAVFYSGNNDALIAHRGTEVTIQNTTFGGIQGFTRKPSTPWNDDSGNFAGIVHQERNWTYVLFNNVGHVVPEGAPSAAFTFFREFVVGHNQTGLVLTTPNGSTVVGGENATLAADVMPGRDEVIYGSGTVVSTFVFPQATRDAWQQFIRTETATPTGVAGRANTASAGAVVLGGRGALSWIVGVIGLVSTCVYVL